MGCIVDEMVSCRKPPTLDHMIAFIHKCKAVLKFYPAKNGDDGKEDESGQKNIELTVSFFYGFGHFNSRLW